MTVTELNLGRFSAEEASNRLADRAEHLDGNKLDPASALVERLIDAAESDGVNVQNIDVHTDDRFTNQDRKLITAALVERAERTVVERTQAKLDAIKAQAKREHPKNTLPLLPKRKDGWYLDARQHSPDVPEYGPYDTKAEAEEARISFLRSAKRQAKEKPVRHVCNHQWKTVEGETFCAKCFAPDSPPKKIEEVLKPKAVKASKPATKAGDPGYAATRKEAARKAWETRKANLAKKGVVA